MSKKVEVTLPDDTEIKSKAQKSSAGGANETPGPTDVGQQPGDGEGEAKAHLATKPVKMVRCPECGEKKHPKYLALHRYNAHGVKKEGGETKPKKTKTGPETAASTSSDATDTTSASEESEITLWLKQHVVEAILIVLSGIAVGFFLWLAVKKRGEDTDSVGAVDGEAPGIAGPVVQAVTPHVETASERAMRESGMSQPLGAGETPNLMAL